MTISLHQQEAQRIIEQELNLSICEDNYDNWLSALGAKINDLISTDFNKLIFVLYRLDINELKLKKILKDNPHSDTGMMIGKLIIERQLQKLATRASFKKDDADINENEKW